MSFWGWIIQNQETTYYMGVVQIPHGLFRGMCRAHCNVLSNECTEPAVGECACPNYPAKSRTIVTRAFFRSRFSSSRLLHLYRNVSSSIFSTRFSCCSESTRLDSSSRPVVVVCDHAIDVEPPSAELASLSKSLPKLSAILLLTTWDCNV